MAQTVLEPEHLAIVEAEIAEVLLALGCASPPYSAAIEVTRTQTLTLTTDPYPNPHPNPHPNPNPSPDPNPSQDLPKLLHEYFGRIDPMETWWTLRLLRPAHLRAAGAPGLVDVIAALSHYTSLRLEADATDASRLRVRLDLQAKVS